MDINKFTSNLFVQISECCDILNLIEEVESYKKIMPLIQKARLQKYLVDHLVTKLNTLFENDNKVISFERLHCEYMSKDQNFTAKYNKIKKVFGNLIKQIGNNRTKIAHNPKQNILGYSSEELKDFEKSTSIRLPDLSQTTENQYILFSNLPKDGIIVLLQELKNLAFYEVLHPEAKKYNPTTCEFIK